MTMTSDAGTPPDRKVQMDLAVFEYESAVRRGEEPDRAALVARYPELGDYLRARAEESRLDRTEGASSDDPERTHPHVSAGEVDSLARDGPPERIGDYILGEKLGGGGQGLVFRARHSLGDLTVALKMVAAKDDADSLQEEIRAIASLRHEH